MACFFEFEFRSIQSILGRKMSTNNTLVSLRGHKVLYQGVCGLRVEGERVLQRLQILRLVDVAHLEPDAARVEVLLDRLEGGLQHRTLLRAQSPEI